MSAATDAPRSAPALPLPQARRTLLGASLAPVLYGTVGDFAGPAWGTASAAVGALLVCPLALLLAPRLRAIA